MPNPDLASERRAFEAWVRKIDEETGVTNFDLWLLRWPDTGAYRRDHLEHRWQGWLARSAVLTVVGEEMEAIFAKIICHYPSGPSGVNSCCPDEMGSKRCQHKARACLTAALTVSSERED